MKTRISLVLLAASFLIPAWAALAHVEAFQATAWSVSFTGIARVDGRIACSIGERFEVDVKVVQVESGYEGKGFTRVRDCTGNQQTWRTFITDESGEFNTCETTEIRSKALTKLGGERHGSASDLQTIPPICG
jgi:hypothetical protein